MSFTGSRRACVWVALQLWRPPTCSRSMNTWRFCGQSSATAGTGWHDTGGLFSVVDPDVRRFRVVPVRLRRRGTHSSPRSGWRRRRLLCGWRARCWWRHRRRGGPGLGLGQVRPGHRPIVALSVQARWQSRRHRTHAHGECAGSCGRPSELIGQGVGVNCGLAVGNQQGLLVG